MPSVKSLISSALSNTITISNKLVLYSQWQKLMEKKFKQVHIIYLLHNLSEYDKISLKSLFSTKADNTQLSYTFVCEARIKVHLINYLNTTYPEFKNFDTLEYDNFPTINSFLEACKRNKYGLKAFVSSYLIFHPLWLEKSLEVASSAIKNKPLFSGFSSFNPNDFKLIQTEIINEEDGYTIKNGFSFNAIIFPDFILKKASKHLGSDSSQKDFYEAIKAINPSFLFTSESYTEVHSYDLNHPFDNFHEKPNNLSFSTSRVKVGWDASIKDTIPKFNKLVLHVNYGGLGDNLFLSHLPRIAKETAGYKRVLLSERSVLRNTDYKNLIWNTNPYIDGFTDEMGYYIEFLKFDTAKMNILSHIMHLYGLDDGNMFHEPELYYKPQIMAELEGKLIFDPNYVSDAGNNISPEAIDNYFKENNIKIDYQMQLRDKSIATSHFSEWLKSESLEDFFNIIASCKALYCFASGTATLASALKKKAFVFYKEGFNQQFLHSPSNTYIKL